MTKPPKYAVVAVPPNRLDSVWAEVAETLHGSIVQAAGTHTLGDIYDAIKSGELQLWVTRQGDRLVVAYMTKVTKYPRLKALSVDWLGGVPQEALEALRFEGLPHMLKFAKELGCSHVEWQGRGEWARALRKQGAHSTYTSFRIEV